MKRKIIALAAAAMGLSIFLAPTVSADEIFDQFVSTSTINNAGAVFFGGTVQGIPAASTADRWVGQVFAGANECLRVHVTSQGSDLETVVVTPGGGVARNDDGGGTCSLCPLVKINGTQRGWHTVSIAHFTGSPVLADFSLAYGRFNVGNPNCSFPTAIINAPAGAKSSSASPGPSNGPTD